MNPPLEGQVTCRVHLAATVISLMVDDGALLAIRRINNTTTSDFLHCTCMLDAEFYVVSVGKDEDEPFPLFRSL